MSQDVITIKHCETPIVNKNDILQVVPPEFTIKDLIPWNNKAIELVRGIRESQSINRIYMNCIYPSLNIKPKEENQEYYKSNKPIKDFNYDETCFINPKLSQYFEEVLTCTCQNIPCYKNDQ